MRIIYDAHRIAASHGVTTEQRGDYATMLASAFVSIGDAIGQTLDARDLVGAGNMPGTREAAVVRVACDMIDHDPETGELRLSARPSDRDVAWLRRLLGEAVAR